MFTKKKKEISDFAKCMEDRLSELENNPENISIADLNDQIVEAVQTYHNTSKQINSYLLKYLGKDFEYRLQVIEGQMLISCCKIEMVHYNLKSLQLGFKMGKNKDSTS